MTFRRHARTNGTGADTEPAGNPLTTRRRCRLCLGRARCHHRWAPEWAGRHTAGGWRRRAVAIRRSSSRTESGFLTKSSAPVPSGRVPTPHGVGWTTQCPRWTQTGHVQPIVSGWLSAVLRPRLTTPREVTLYAARAHLSEFDQWVRGHGMAGSPRHHPPGGHAGLAPHLSDRDVRDHRTRLRFHGRTDDADAVLRPRAPLRPVRRLRRLRVCRVIDRPSPRLGHRDRRLNRG